MTACDPNVEPVSTKSYIKFGEIQAFVLKILNGNEILAQINSYNSGTNVRKMMCNNPNADLVNINAYIKFGEILSICSQDFERKRKYGVYQET